MISEGYGEESETACVYPIPHQGDHKRVLLSWPIPGRYLEKRHPFGTKKSDITCGISFGVCGGERGEGGEERGGEKKKRRKGWGGGWREVRW